MTIPILTKRSTTAGVAPTTAQLAVGELGLNTEDGYLFAKNAAGTVVQQIGTTASRVALTASGLQTKTNVQDAVSILATPVTADALKDVKINSGGTGYDLVGHEVIVASGMVNDCTGQGVGTDNSATFQSYLNAWKAAGDGAVLVVPYGRFRLASAVSVDLAGQCHKKLICYGAFTSDSVAMKVVTIQNAYFLHLKASIYEGGIYNSGLSNPFIVDYSSVFDASGGGGQEFFYLTGIFGLVLDIEATNYAGRDVTWGRMTTDTVFAAHIRGQIKNSRLENLSSPRCGQSIYSTQNTGTVGAWGSMEVINCDFDGYGPVWVSLNDINVTYLEGAFSNRGPVCDTCINVFGATWYVGDIDTNASNVHFEFTSCGNVRIPNIIGLNQGYIVKFTNLDGNYGAEVGIQAIGTSGNTYARALWVVNSVNLRAKVSGDPNGSTLVYVEGSTSDEIFLEVNGNGLAGNLVEFAADFGGYAEVSGFLKNPAAGFAALKVSNTGCAIQIKHLLASASAGSCFDVPSANNIRWLGGRAYVSGTAVLWANGYTINYVDSSVVT